MKNQNGMNLLDLLVEFKRKIKTKTMFTIITDGNNDYEIFLSENKEDRNELLIFDLIGELHSAKKKNILKFSDGGYFVMDGKQSILLYDSRDISEDEAGDSGEITV